MTFGQAAALYMQRVDVNVSLKSATKHYWNALLAALLRNWPGLGELEIRRITATACRDWATRQAKTASPSRFHNAVALLRHIINIAIESEAGEIVVNGDSEEGTKNGEIRRLPMIPQARERFAKMREARADEPSTAGVLVVRECQKSMERAASKIGMTRITHHDLRHFFANVSIESGGPFCQSSSHGLRCAAHSPPGC